MAMTHARREEIARQKGYSSYGEYRRASPAERELATQRIVGRGDYKGSTNTVIAQNRRSAAGKGRRQYVHKSGSTEVLRQRGGTAMVERLLNAAKRDGADITHIQVKYGNQNVELWRHGSSIESLRNQIGGAGGLTPLVGAIMDEAYGDASDIGVDDYEDFDEIQIGLVW